MNKVISIASYGIALFSEGVLVSFLKDNKIRSKKVLKLFQDNQSLYLDSLGKGIWLPILPIDSTRYSIKLSNNGEGFDGEWEKEIEESGFNLTVQDSFWVVGLGVLNDISKEDFSSETISYETLDGKTLFQAFRFACPSGKYKVKIQGYKSKVEKEFPQTNYGFLFSLSKVEDFDGNKDPREDNKYNFNIAQV